MLTMFSASSTGRLLSKFKTSGFNFSWKWFTSDSVSIASLFRTYCTTPYCGIFRYEATKRGSHITSSSYNNPLESCLIYRIEWSWTFVLSLEICMFNVLIVISGIYGLYAAIEESNTGWQWPWHMYIVLNVFIYIHYSMVTAIWFIVTQELYIPK